VVGLPLFQFLLEQHWGYALSAVITCLTVVGLTIAFSEIFYQLVDKNTMKLSAKISNRFI
jgi:peptidoglycan/LPS O-acetylase OafA/YrhL